SLVSWMFAIVSLCVLLCLSVLFFFFSSRRRHTRCYRDWSSDVCSSDLKLYILGGGISWIGVPSFPMAHASLALALNFLFTPSECGRPHTLEVRLLDPDGRELVPRSEEHTSELQSR